jgi:hypothetical protein
VSSIRAQSSGRNVLESSFGKGTPVWDRRIDDQVATVGQDRIAKCLRME